MMEEFNEITLNNPNILNKIEKEDNSKPLISIIVPIYNSEKYLFKTISSIINQTLLNIEIICIDDCSTDNSLNIIKNFAKIDNRIKNFSNEKNSGVSFTRNVGLKKAKGNFVMFIDSDDIVKNDFCEQMYKHIINNKSNLVICDAETILDSGFNSKTREVNLNRNYATLTSHMLWNKIFRKDLIDKYKLVFPTDIKGGEDVYFTICYKSICDNKVDILNKKLYCYLIRENSLMSTSSLKDNEQMFDCFKISNHIYNFFRTNGKRNEVYDIFFANIKFGISKFTEKNYNKVANIIYDMIKEKPEIKIDHDCFIVNDKKFYIKQEVFDKVNNLYNLKKQRINFYQ